MRTILLILYSLAVVSCSSNSELIRKIDLEIQKKTLTLHKNAKETESELEQIKFISLELEAAKLNSNLLERIASSKELSEKIQRILSKEKQRKLENNIISKELDSLILRKKELLKM